MSTLLKKVERPRELSWVQAGSMLYGDWGTSKAYVLGLAFAIAGHASMFFLLAMSVLTAAIGFCYTIVCKAYPDGGGVYSAARAKSKTLSVVGALLLIAGYVVTAAISSIEAFHYFGVSHPFLWAVGSLGVIGLINVVGAKKSGHIATFIAGMTIVALSMLCLASLPHIKNMQIAMPEGSFMGNWVRFTGIILALSGVEAIANVTGIMKQPVEQTSKKAIYPVMLEVTVISLILGAAMNAIPGLAGHTEDMIRAIGNYYVGNWFGSIVAFLMGLLLLSACNTAIMGLVSVMFLMSKDKELPPVFSAINRFGMPWFSLLIAVAVPVLVLIIDHDVHHLASLYAIGVVGAIMINLTSCFLNFDIKIKPAERFVLGVASAIMILVELTIILGKPRAVVFAVTILAVGLAARTVARWTEKLRVVLPEVTGIDVLTAQEARDLMPLYKGSTLVAVKYNNPSLVEEAVLHAKGKGESVVYSLFVEEKPPGWAYPTEVEPSKEAVKILRQTVADFEKQGITSVPLWSLGDNTGRLIVKTAQELNLDTVMIGSTRRGAFERLLRGEVLKTITENLPEEKHLLICN